MADGTESSKRQRRSEAWHEQQRCLTQLREWLKPGDEVSTILRHVSRSGMQRAISVVIPDTEDGCRPFDASYWVARALDYRIDQNHGGLKVGGAGMDMGYHVVYSLSRALFPDGFDCINPDDPYGYQDRKRRCPSNDHSNHVDATHHNDGGYALTHRWL